MGQGLLLRAKVLFTPRCPASLTALELSWDVTSVPQPGSIFISVKVSASVRYIVKYFFAALLMLGMMPSSELVLERYVNLKSVS